ncbi:MAG TPA: flagellar biosynthetic protein FliR [Stellaceae bacterium]|nr:flagellar biosynthetic protein FliR [Stellaceae bacterium]
MLNFATTDIARWAGEFFWPFLRILALLAAAPGFNATAIPARIKVALAFVIALVISGLIKQSTPLDLSWTAGALAVQQVLVGVAIGFSMQIVLAAIAVAGEFIGVQMGFGIASLFDPQSGFTVPVMSNFFSLTGLVLFLAMNGHLVMLRVLVKSFDAVPIAPGAGIAAGGWRALAAAGSSLFQTGLWLALPVIAVLLAAHAAVAILSRVAPQFNVISVGFSVFMLVGIAASVTLVPFFVPAVSHIIETGALLATRLLNPTAP